jgi:hypothetical protein
MERKRVRKSKRGGIRGSMEDEGGENSCCSFLLANQRQILGNT